MLWKEKLHTEGFVHIQNSTLTETFKYVEELGRVSLYTPVEPDYKSPALVRSFKALPLHTDHHKVKYIIWFCEARDNEGGISLLLDTKPLLDKFSEGEKQELNNIYLQEHPIFYNDSREFPILSKTQTSDYHFYYTFWLARKEDKEKPVFKKLYKEIKKAEVVRIHLSPGDILIINNWRMLHGRTEIKNHRRLLRFWTW